MSHVMDKQGIHLNKWTEQRVDYFTREADWHDFKDLVSRPASEVLEFTEDAYEALHEATYGNPFFTKRICQEIFRRAVTNRDCFVGWPEVEEALSATIHETSRNTFQHFWQDGIVDEGEVAEEKSVRRRVLLIAMIDLFRRVTPVNVEEIEKNQLVSSFGVDVESELQEFVARNVLVSVPERRTFHFRVPLFKKWLHERGVQDLITTFQSISGPLRERQKKEDVRVQSREVLDIADRHWTYRGQVVTSDRIRVWLDQFTESSEQRLMFEMLSRTRFYSDAYIRRKMHDMFQMLGRESTEQRKAGKLKRSDILVAYLDAPSKSGARLARIFAQEVNLYVDNVVEKGRVNEQLIARPNVQVLVFIDDIVATGDSAAQMLQELDSFIAQTVRERQIKVFFACVVALDDGWKSLEGVVESLQTKVDIKACEFLDSSARCFSASSSIFPDEQKRLDARLVALDYGKRLEKNCPLGYGDLELCVAFEHGCPNNSLPVLWSDSVGWKPLFPR